ncbi:hypothetical protein BH10PSE7_BH10PSE7_17200 [soil metagenome]
MSGALTLSSSFMGEVAAARPEGARVYARRLRKTMTHAEVLLWLQLKTINKEYRCHFRRQAPLGKYILDFVDFSRRLVIEIDGWQHGEAPGIRRDEARDAFLSGQGFRVLRFWNHEVQKHLDGVCEAIIAVIREHPPRHPLRRYAPPPP